MFVKSPTYNCIHTHHYTFHQHHQTIATVSMKVSHQHTGVSIKVQGFSIQYAYVVKLDNQSVVRRQKKWLKSMKFYKIYVKLSIISRNPQENLIYLNISDCSPDEMQSLINTMRILMISKPYLNKHFPVTEDLLFASERARFADSGAIFGFKIEERWVSQLTIWSHFNLSGS